MLPLIIHTIKSNKKKTLKNGIVFDATKRIIEQPIEKRSLDADVVQKKKGTSEVINPSVASTPERY